ncbi:LysR family transcriptional regulator [Bdellovibrio sp. NC01]|uniref:LysR family transcriptional regulator n=1 Tax=Bdellovibrio sp. NC01 TaxID=2220073 RepID=UPI001159AD95|nr:LysR family transcriptional regulator [Bdellovibrio sp. NC01]QDK37993.1 LysR family transcriptional regulator [Bdellovibrio sp. NC01]
MEPNLYHLRYFLDAVRLGGVAAAAQKNRVSQSAVSQAIKKLEDSLGATLLVHSKNQFKVSPEGLRLLESMEGVLDSVRVLRSVLAGAQEENAGPLSMATLRSLALVLFPGVMSSLQKNHQKIEPVLKIGHTKNILEQVLDGEIEVGVVMDNKALRGVDKYILHEGHFCCVIGKGFKDQYKTLGFLATEEKPGVAEVRKLYKNRYKKTAPVSMIVESWEVIARFASEGLGIGFVPDFVAASVPHLQLTEVYSEFAHKIKYKIVLISKGDLSANAQLLAKELERSTAKVFQSAIS